MSASGARRFEPLIAAILTGAEVEWDFSDPGAGRGFLETCVSHGVTPLVEDRLKRSAGWTTWPEAVRRELASRAVGNGLLQTLAEGDLRAVLSQADTQGVRPLVLKGAALAHTHYRRPHLRPRGDTDLLIEEPDRAVLEEILRGLGYRTGQAHAGTLILFQSNFVRTDANGFSHCFDLHWRISNAHVFAHAFGFEELSRRARPVPALGEHARTCHPVDALALACLHRVGHHANSRRLIWLYDIHLLAEGLTEPQREELLAVAREKKLEAVCWAGLTAARDVFGGEGTAWLADRLKAGDWADEPGAALLGDSQRRIDVLASDLRNLPGLGPKLRLILQHLFPPPTFMLRRYPGRSRLWLPWLYLHRAARGLRRILARSGEEKTGQA